jgi:hypothetical protein
LRITCWQVERFWDARHPGEVAGAVVARIAGHPTKHVDELLPGI